MASEHPELGGDELQAPEDAWLAGALDGLSPSDQQALQRIARDAKPLPDTLSAAWAELAAIRRRDAGKGPLYPNAVVLEVYRLRAALLEDLLLLELPARGLDDLRLRVDYLTLLRAQPQHPPLEPQSFARILQRLGDDLAALEAVPASEAPRSEEAAGPQGLPPRRHGETATERRAAVIAYLCDPDLAVWSDRAIARACGVSPQTVGNWRRKLSGQVGQMAQDEAQRTFARGGRIHRMNTLGIGKSP